MRIGVDIDGVLRDFVGFLALFYHSQFPTHRIVPYEDWSWKLVKNFPDWQGTSKEFDDWVFKTHCRALMVSASPYPGAVNAINRFISTTRHDVVMVSHQRKGTEPYTLEWLGKNGITVSETRFEKEKLKAECDLLIDDKVQNLEDYYTSGKMVIAISRPWNREWKKTVRKENIQQAIELLEAL